MKIIRIFMVTILVGWMITCTKKTDSTLKNQITGNVEVYHISGDKIGTADHVSVKIFNTDHYIIKETVTDQNGIYIVDNLSPGIYYVKISDDRYYSKPGSDILQFSVSENTSRDLSAIKLDTYKIYPKSTAGIKSITWRQSDKSDHQVMLDIIFDHLDLSMYDKYVFVYFFIGHDEHVSKTNYQGKIYPSADNGYISGYHMARIPVEEIINNQVNGYQDNNFCRWMDGSLCYPKQPTHLAMYVSTASGYGEEGSSGEDEYSGIGHIRFVKNIDDLHDCF
ncbi:MAG: carboxypeptidase-like regulatory domain-containing protein [Bacteroidales bacterium]|jgi:hypothetical protein|nr:carboxypeptidase-like regulatory domain-containing protein [Bacteroidales bacterium]